MREDDRYRYFDAVQTTLFSLRYVASLSYTFIFDAKNNIAGFLLRRRLGNAIGNKFYPVKFSSQLLQIINELWGVLYIIRVIMMWRLRLLWFLHFPKLWSSFDHLIFYMIYQHLLWFYHMRCLQGQNGILKFDTK